MHKVSHVLRPDEAASVPDVLPSGHENYPQEHCIDMVLTFCTQTSYMTLYPLLRRMV